ncbi:MAG TPA: BlaI/MecI/CopY family transcriptional regulator [Planctomycetaceae bacterium]
MARRREELSETEQDVLKTLWELGAGTVRDVCEAMNRRGPRRAYTTVLTFLVRLETKGYVSSNRAELAHVFRPIVSREGLLTQRLTRLVDDVCEGTAAPVVQALVRGKQLSTDDIAHLRRLLDELEDESDRKATISKHKRKK